MRADLAEARSRPGGPFGTGRQPHFDAGTVSPDPAGQFEARHIAAGSDIANNDVYDERRVGQSLHRFIRVERLDDPIAAMSQIAGYRVARDDVAVDDDCIRLR